MTAILRRFSFLNKRPPTLEKATFANDVTIATQTDILIIGAGPAGLALAQILKANNISSKVFERDPAIDARGQGWAVVLRESIDRLIQALPSSLGDIRQTSVNASSGLLDNGVVIDGATSESIGHIGGQPLGKPDFMLRVRRKRLQHYLSKEVDIEYNRHFDHYEEDANGVTAIFKDGTRHRGCILVGADGASSHVRSQLLPNSQSVPALYLPIVGMLKLSSKEDVEEYQRIATAVFIACTDGLRFMTGVLDVEADFSSASAYFAVCYKVQDTEKEIEWLSKASQEELFAKALEKTRPINPSLTKYIHMSGSEGILTPPRAFREFLPPVSLPRGRVTMMGDALHTMIPFRGAGANTALLDACDLADSLRKVPDVKDRETVITALHEYACMACPRGRDVVAATHAAGEDMHMVFGLEKILERQLAELQKGERRRIV